MGIELSESMEDYLEIILNLERTNKVARSKDIAEKLGVKRGSVTGALKNLAKKKLIDYEPYGFITLSSKGKKIAEEIDFRHSVLKDFLFRILQLDDENSEITACRLEHAMDKTSISKLVKFISFIDNCPKNGAEWIKKYIDFCSDSIPDWEKCNECIDSCNKRHKSNKK